MLDQIRKLSFVIVNLFFGFFSDLNVHQSGYISIAPNITNNFVCKFLKFFQILVQLLP
jgi:hypothetical protein